jgi:hypothetical protein
MSYNIGDFEDNVPNGYGKVSFSDGDKSEGYYKNGAPHGHLIYQQLNGKRFEGEYVNGKREGPGIEKNTKYLKTII